MNEDQDFTIGSIPRKMNVAGAAIFGIIISLVYYIYLRKKKIIVME